MEEWSLFEAFYFSLVTLSTIGFGNVAEIYLGSFL
jgi:hypothetical protein